MVKVYPTNDDLAKDFASEVIQKFDDASQLGKPFYLMLSGGNTPKLLFEYMAKFSRDKKCWDHVHLYWGDERCVPPEHPDSNFGMAKQTLLDHINIPAKNIHRIHGEDDPEKEAMRYAAELAAVPAFENGSPVFDLIMLGMGDDGHTVSIFPVNLFLMKSQKLCEVSSHPKTGQKRITVTGGVINQANKVVFLVTGKNKAVILAEILGKTNSYLNYPASHVHPEKGELNWLLDKDAAFFLDE